MWMILFMKMKYVIAGVMVKYVVIGIKRSATLPFMMTEEVLMVIGEMDLALRPVLLPTII